MAKKIDPSALELVIDVEPAPFLTDRLIGQMLAIPIPTPENTPVPGGGRWRWDIAAPGWMDVDAAPLTPDSVTQATPIQPE